MQAISAQDKADDLLKLMLTHQRELFGTQYLTTPEYAKQIATSIASFRQELIAQLQKQEG